MTHEEEVQKKVEIANLAIRAGFWIKSEAVRMCEQHTYDEMRSKLNRLIDTVDVPPSQAGNDLVMKVMFG